MSINNKKFSDVPGFCKITNLYVLRLLVTAGVSKSLYNQFEYDLNLSDGLKINVKDNEDNYSFKVAIRSLRSALDIAEGEKIALPEKSPLINNLAWVKDKFKLNKLDIEILLLVILSRQDHHLRYVFNNTDNLSTSQLIYVVAKTLNRSIGSITKSITDSSRLVRCGLLNISNTLITDFFDKLSLPTGFSYQMSLPQENPFQLFGDSFRQNKPSDLTREDYPHLSNEITYLAAYLKQSKLEKKKGVNILIFGEPGTGKTEFVSMLSTLLKVECFDVASSRIDGTAIAASARMQSYLVAQSTLGVNSKNRFILFDEVEDVFDNEQEQSNSRKVPTGGKCWLNNILESNLIPAFWVTNDITQIDQAHMRRFDFHLEIKTPPKSVRLKIINHYLKDLPVSENWRNHLADNQDLVPAVVGRTHGVANAILKQLPNVSPEKVLNTVLKNSLTSMSKSFSAPKSSESIGFRLDAINANIDLKKLAHSICLNPQARLCLFGPPGTGKSAFARELAHSANLPLLVKRASDIISPYVGQTEINISHIFNEAKEEGALLLLDEVDSFLQSREKAQKSWEITAVNEMLTQMESFEGILVASTNLMKDLDSAALRRFDFKIEFKYLKFEQILVLLKEAANLLNIEFSHLDIQKAKKIVHLTPGDFSNVLRQAKLLPIQNGLDLLNRLEMECRVKPDFNSHVIGFAA